ncbi:MAG: adenylyl-sulfate kinase [Abditibacteriales bacterium]|nr:adenylyl-sulfate kinase [Abditibacteriales bacterium]MDW8365278.1 adenylyl-sulfate kinase [Abditibacteriales bacterium]
MDKGFVIWFTGVPASGKSTAANGVAAALRERGVKVEVLDADIVRRELSPDLGFEKKDRDLNTKRLTFIGKLLARNGVACLIAASASYREFRDRARNEIENFVECWVKCPLEVCQRRDPKGLYARAARGEISNVEGIHQPYEEPLHPEVVLETDKESPEECVAKVMATLERLGYLDAKPEAAEVYSEEDEEKVAKRLKALGYI